MLVALTAGSLAVKTKSCKMEILQSPEDRIAKISQDTVLSMLVWLWVILGKCEVCCEGAKSHMSIPTVKYYCT